MPTSSLLAPSRRLIVSSLAIVILLAVVCAPGVAAADTTFSITGRGYGHGVGMSQYGAKGYADKGWTHERILAWFYTGTTLAARTASTVKVDLDAGKAARSSWRLAAGSTTATLTITNATNATDTLVIAPGRTVWITFSGSGARICADKYVSTGKFAPSTVLKSFSGAVIASSNTLSRSTVVLRSTSGPFGEAGIIWRGVIRFVPTAATTGHAINYVLMDQYVQGVVPRESPSGWPAEALEAQAIAARSYAYSAAAAGSTLWCTTMSQVYNGADCSTAGHERHEADSTNRAVRGTPDKVVVKGSTVVTTYFSSSSGGRTANSKDVWFSNRADTVTPLEYSSVVDADQASPYYRWKPVSMSGTAMGAAIRSHYPGAAAKSPAWVKSVTLEPGKSGFVRYITLRWSTGVSYTIKGEEFRHALGLKSTAFSVTVPGSPAPPAPPARVGTRFEQTDTRYWWYGTWIHVDQATLSGGSYRKTNKSGPTFTAAFKGTTVSWIGLRAAICGTARVYLDGVSMATVNLYAPKTSYKQALWSRAGLSSDATHTLVIKPTGSHGSGASDSYVGIDAVDVVGTLVQAKAPSAVVTATVSRITGSVSAVTVGAVWTLKGTVAPSAPGVVALTYLPPGATVYQYMTARPLVGGAWSYNIKAKLPKGVWRYKVLYAGERGYGLSQAGPFSITVK